MSTQHTPGFWDDAEVISTYSRAEAIEDGSLIDISAIAREAGFKYPTAITAGAWAGYVAWSAADNENKGTAQDEQGRLWDVVWMAAVACRARMRAQPNDTADRWPFKFCCVPRDGKATRARLAELHIHIGPGDDAAPVLTILLPHED